jgi:hypothetical protein
MSSSGTGLTVEIADVTGDLTHNAGRLASLVDEVWAPVSSGRCP